MWQKKAEECGGIPLFVRNLTKCYFGKLGEGLFYLFFVGALFFQYEIELS